MDVNEHFALTRRGAEPDRRVRRPVGRFGGRPPFLSTTTRGGSTSSARGTGSESRAAPGTLARRGRRCRLAPHGVDVPFAGAERCCSGVDPRVSADLRLAVDDLPRPSITSATMRLSWASRSQGRAPASRTTASCTSTAARCAEARRCSTGWRIHFDDAGPSRRVPAQRWQRPAQAVHRKVVARMKQQVARATELQQRDVVRRGGAGSQDVADQRHLTGHRSHVTPFLGDQVVVHGALARVVDQVVHDGALHAALEQRAALGVVRVQVADNQDLLDVVVDQRALRVFALDVGRIGQAVGDEVAAEGDPVRRARRAIRRASCRSNRGPEAERFSSVAQVSEQWSTITSCAPPWSKVASNSGRRVLQRPPRRGGRGCAGRSTSCVTMSMPPRINVMPGEGAVWPAMVMNGDSIFRACLLEIDHARQPRTRRSAVRDGQRPRRTIRGRAAFSYVTRMTAPPRPPGVVAAQPWAPGNASCCCLAPPANRAARTQEQRRASGKPDQRHASPRYWFEGCILTPVSLVRHQWDHREPSR